MHGADGPGSPKKVAYVISMPHGVDRWTYQEIGELIGSGIGVSIFPLKVGPGPYTPSASWDCYRLNRWLILAKQASLLARSPRAYLALLAESIRTGTVVDFLLAADFAGQMARRSIGLIHCVFGDHKLFVGYYCKRLLGVPLSVALYGYDLRANPNWAMFRRAVRLCDDIIVNCEFNRRLLAEVAGEDVGRRARVIRHYAEVAGGHAGRFRVLIVGGLVERKGHDLLFQAVRSLGPDAADFEVWVVGYPGPVDARRLARELGVEDRVRVFGSVADQGLDTLYELCDVFCLPSRTDRDGVSEGLPVALIEAMAHGKPVIATRLGGVPELVEEALVDEGDVAGLARALKRFKDDAALRRASGARNREIVEARYSKRNVSELKDLFLARLRP